MSLQVGCSLNRDIVVSENWETSTFLLETGVHKKNITLLGSTSLDLVDIMASQHETKTSKSLRKSPQIPPLFGVQRLRRQDIRIWGVD